MKLPKLFPVLILSFCLKWVLAQNDTEFDDGILVDDDEHFVYSVPDYSDAWDIWNTYGNKPCHPGTQLAHQICIPWNYTKEDRPENKSAVS